MKVVLAGTWAGLSCVLAAACGSVEDDGEPLASLEEAAPYALIAARTTHQVELDGSFQEAAWALAPEIVFLDPARSDNSTQLRALWDREHLYLGVTVTDTKLETSADGDIVADDGLEFVFDTGNERGQSLDANDVRLVASLRNAANLPDVVVRVRRVASVRYTMEIQIPWESLGVTPALGKILGLFAATTDRDDGSLSGVDWLGLLASSAACRPSAWGSLYLASSSPPLPLRSPPSPAPLGVGVSLPGGLLSAGRVCDALTVDGHLSEDAWRVSDYVEFSIPALSDNVTRVRATWTDSTLYFGYNVQDASLEPVGGEAWQVDGTELFLDMGHERGTVLDSNDAHFIHTFAGTSTGPPTAFAVALTPTGYAVEIAIAWNTLRASPSAGSTYGLLVTNNDRDNGSPSQYDWRGAIFSGTYFNPSLWGTLQLRPEITSP
ncbi:MAG: sugar-binding protein [Myxococcaceae bacterium]